MDQQTPQMQGMQVPAGAYAAAPPQQMAYSGAPGANSAAPAPSAQGDGCCCKCSNNKRSALYTWLPIGLRIGLFFWCLIAFSLCLSTKNGVTGYSAGAFLVGMTILGFIFAVFVLVYLIVRIFVAGSEAYDASMDLAQLFESYIMTLLLFAASTSASAAVNMWWNSSAMANIQGMSYGSSMENLLAQYGVTLPDSYGKTETMNHLNNYLNDIQNDVNKVRGAAAMGFFAAFTYIALYWYLNLRVYKRGVLRASRDAAVPAGKVDAPAGKVDAPPPYNV